MGDGLPGAEFWALIHPHTGDVTRAERTPRGFSSDLTALVDAARGRFFVKAVRNSAGGRRDSVVREGLVNQAVRPISPPLCWQAEDDAWNVLGFTAVEGRAAGFEPGSSDLPDVVDAVRRIGQVPVPEVAREWGETRWDRFAGDPAEAARFRGGALLHTDINPSNVLLGEGATWVVDWAWPTLGAAFIDPALLVLQLVASGHGPAAAESWAAGCPAWTCADPSAIDAFALANLRMYRHLAERRPEAAWLAAMEEAAHRWTSYRQP